MEIFRSVEWNIYVNFSRMEYICKLLHEGLKCKIYSELYRLIHVGTNLVEIKQPILISLVILFLTIKTAADS